MARELVLHVGTPKSGTTHLQSVLVRGRARLARDGVLYPGAGRLPRDGFNQQPAVYAVTGADTGWADDAVRRTARTHLEHLRRETAAHPGRTLVSAESLSFADVDAGRRLLDVLGYDPAAVTVVITARDLGRVLPSIWQQNVKNGATQALGPYLESVASLRGGPPSPLWTAFGVPGLVERWARVVGGTERVVVVTVPRQRAGADTLWHRFAAATSVAPDLVDEPGPRVRAVDNLSLTLAQAEVIRAMNGVMQAAGYDRDRQQRLRGHLLGVWMNRPSAGGEPPDVPAPLHDDVRRWGAADVAALRASGVRVVGSLADLEPHLTERPERPAPTVAEATGHDVLALLEHADALARVRPMPPWLDRALRAARPLARWRAAARAMPARVRRGRRPGSAAAAADPGEGPRDRSLTGSR